MHRLLTFLTFGFLVLASNLHAQVNSTLFSNIPTYGDTSNYIPTNAWLWDVIEDGGDLRYGIILDKESGGDRTSIVKDKWFGYDFYVTADAKLFKRVWGATDEPLFEDASLFFLYNDANNYAKAEFFNTNGPYVGAGVNAFGLSGFTVVVEGVTYKFKKSDAPEDPVEGTPAETCIPFVNDQSFNDWNNIKVTREGTVLSMLANGKVYYSMNIDTLTVFQNGEVQEVLPQSVKDFLMGQGQIGIGSSNDKVYFDNVNAGFIKAVGKFSETGYLGDAVNYTETDPWLWKLVEDGGDLRYGIVLDKEMGGTRTSILNNNSYGFDFFVTADTKLFKRVWGATDAPLFEDASLFFLYNDANNYAKAEFFNTSGPYVGAGVNAFGLSGFTVVVEGATYKFKKSDAPEDPVEGIPAETCIPYVNDQSFNDWNNIKVTREGTVLSMLTNDKMYYSMNIDTLTVYQNGEVLAAIPQAVKDFLMGQGQIGIGSSNDKAYFDNVNAGFIKSKGKFSEIAGAGDAANFTELDPWLWKVVDDGGDLRYGIVLDKEMGGNRTSILNEQWLGHDFHVAADVKLFKRVWGATDAPLFEDASLFFNYHDANNYAKAEFFNTNGPYVGAGVNAFGLSGFTVVVEGVTYKFKKSDALEDPVEGIPAETCIPYVNDLSFNEWNHIELKKDGSVLTMLTNGKVYYSMNIDTLTVYQNGEVLAAIPQSVKYYLNGMGQVGIGSSNDKVYFDNVDFGFKPVTGKFSTVEYAGEAVNYFQTTPWLWGVVEDGGDLRYGVLYDKEVGFDRTSILKDKWLGYDFYVSAETKLFKRVWGATDAPLFEDASLFFLYNDASNYAKAEFFNTNGPFVGAGVNAFGLSGFTVVVNGVTYKFKKSDAPENTVDGIPAETCIPYVNDLSFNDWNKVKVTRKGTVLSMLVNDKAYYSMDIDTLSVYQNGEVLTAIPQSVKDYLKGWGQVGVGSSNDKLYFDNIEAGFNPVVGKFSNTAFLGEAINYSQPDPWLWMVVEDGGDTRYGIVMDKEMGGNRTSILNTNVYDKNFYVSADAKLFKRVWGATDAPLFEDASLFFLYKDANNYAKAEFFNTNGPFVGAGVNAFGLSGFTVVVNSATYKFKKSDAPENTVEGIPAETCIPFVNDLSFNDWNTIKVTRDGSVLTMLTNDKVYYSMDIDTLTQYQNGEVLAAIPQSVKDFLKGSGQIGIGSSNDKVYFDNVNAGVYNGTKAQNIDQAGTISIYPNPASDKITISNTTETKMIEIFSLTGKKVYGLITNGAPTITIDTNQLNKGMYIAKMRNGNGGIKSAKFMISR